jgi:hypothetical protein
MSDDNLQWLRKTCGPHRRVQRPSPLVRTILLCVATLLLVILLTIAYEYNWMVPR